MRGRQRAILLDLVRCRTGQRGRRARLVASVLARTRKKPVSTVTRRAWPGRSCLPTTVTRSSCIVLMPRARRCCHLSDLNPHHDLLPMQVVISAWLIGRYAVAPDAATTTTGIRGLSPVMISEIPDGRGCKHAAAHSRLAAPPATPGRVADRRLARPAWSPPSSADQGRVRPRRACRSRLKHRALSALR